MADIQKAIQTLERDYEQQKELFGKWQEENAALSSHQSYAQYVEQFETWERTVLDRLKELRNCVARQPVAPVPEQPMVDMDTQLEILLKGVTLPQFVLAFMTMAQRDPTFLNKAFEVVIEECRGTGFTNPIIPQQAVHASQSAPSFGGYHHPSGGSVIASASSPSPGTSGLYLPPATGRLPPYHVRQPQPYVAGSSLLSGGGTAAAAHLQPQPSTSGHVMTQFLPIPEGWTIDPAIRKQPKPASPLREYRAPLNLPFKDFSQS